MAGTIIVGVDGNSTSMKAAHVAVNLAKSLDSTLHVVTAYGEDTTEKVTIGNDEWIVSSADEAETVARRVAEELKASGVKIEYSSIFGKPADALIEVATKVGADLIVVGNVRMQGIKRLLGSVANAVSHNAPCDVYIVKTDS